MIYKNSFVGIKWQFWFSLFLILLSCDSERDMMDWSDENWHCPNWVVSPSMIKLNVDTIGDIMGNSVTYIYFFRNPKKCIARDAILLRNSKQLTIRFWGICCTSTHSLLRRYTCFYREIINKPLTFLFILHRQPFKTLKRKTKIFTTNAIYFSL